MRNGYLDNKAVGVFVMALPATEDFASANDPLTNSANWSQPGATADSGEASSGIFADGSINSNDKSAYWSADSFANDQYAQIVLSANGGGNTRLGLILRAGAGNEGLLVRYRADGDFEAFYWDSGGGRNAIGSAYTPTATVSNGDIIRIEISGTTLTLKVDYTGVGDDFTTETTFDASSGPSSGSAGLYIVDDGGTNMQGDDWEGGDLGGGVQITSVSGDNIFADGDSGVPIVGTGFV